MEEKIIITEYTPADHAEVFRLLLVLHLSYFKEKAPDEYQELRQEKNIKRSYENYLNLIENNTDGTWKILVAKTPSGKMAGFIIGSIKKDDDLVISNIGTLEDWFVEPEFRRQGAGQTLYTELEKWFKAKGCNQVCSGTWEGNDLSVTAHKKAGFFISEISFSKKI